MTDLLTLEEVAERLKVPKSWVYNRTRPSATNPIPCHRVGKYLRFVPEEIERYLGINLGKKTDQTISNVESVN